MAVEIRSCRDDEMAQYNRVVEYVFANNDPGGFDADAPTLPDWTTGAFVDGRLATTLGAFPFTVRLNGAPVSMGGVTQVGTLPEFRRQGLLRQVMGQALETMRDRRQSLAVLWASMAAIYQRFGYGIASENVTYRFDPRFAGFQRNEPETGHVTLESAEEAYPTIKQLYIQAATPRNLHIHRASVLWHVDTLRGHPKSLRVYVAVYRNEDGEPRGYAVYTTQEQERHEPGPGHRMVVQDFVWLDLEAYRALWEYLRRHDLVGVVEMQHVAPDDPAPAMLLEPRMLNRRTSDAIWMRVVDVERALPQRPYGDRGELTIGIDGDDLCPWNNGSFLLETDGRTTEVRRTDREPDLVMRPNALATLIAGRYPASFLARLKQIEVREPKAIHIADTLFRTEYAPHCPNNF